MSIAGKMIVPRLRHTAQRLPYVQIPDTAVVQKILQWLINSKCIRRAAMHITVV